MLEGNPEFSTSVQDSIHLLSVILNLLFSVQVQIPDNRNADVGVGTTLALSVDICKIYISIPSSSQGEALYQFLRKTVISEDKVKIRNIN